MGACQAKIVLSIHTVQPYNPITCIAVIKGSAASLRPVDNYYYVMLTYMENQTSADCNGPIRVNVLRTSVTIRVLVASHRFGF